MALKKTWAGTTQTGTSTTAGDYSAADNWEPISLVNPTYRWTASGSGADEYYLELAGGGDPGIAQPTNVQELLSGTRTNMTGGGTLGALTAGQWAYGDNDTLGFSTIYVRLTSGAADPDSRDDKHVTLTAIPAANDDVRIPAKSTTAISSGLDQSAVAIGDFLVESGYSQDIGSEDAYLQIDPNRFEFAATGGTAYIDIGSANITAQIFSTGSAAEGERGLYLLGSNIASVAATGGQTGVAVNHGETSTVATARTIDDASLWLGEGVSLTTWRQTDGVDNRVRCAATTINCYGGELTTEEEGAITTLNCYGGTAVCNSTGTITTLLVQGGTADFLQSAAARTVTNAKHNSGELKYDPGVLTITNRNAPDFPTELRAELPA